MKPSAMSPFTEKCWKHAIGLSNTYVAILWLLDGSWWGLWPALVALMFSSMRIK